MAISYVQAHTGSQDTATDATVTVTLAADVPAGNMIVVGTAADNTGTSTPTVSSVSTPGGESASWVQLAEFDSSTATAAGGVVGEMWGIVTTQQWNSGTVITVTWSASVARKVAVCDEWTGEVSTTKLGTHAKTAATTGPSSITTSTNPNAAGQLVLGLHGFETSNILTGDTDTTNGSWTSVNFQRTASGGAAANVAAAMQGKVVSATGAQTYSAAGATGDNGVCIVVLQAAASGVTGTASPSQAPQTSSATGKLGYSGTSARTQAGQYGIGIAPEQYPDETIIWGGTSGHPYTTTGGTGSTFNLNDTADFAIGDRSIRITTNGTGQNTFVRVLNGPAMNFTNRVPRIWIKVDTNARFLDGTLWLGSGGGLGSAYQWSLEPDDAVVPYYASGEWVSMTLPWSAATVVGTPNRAALTDVNFQVFDDSGGALTVRWGGLTSVPDTSRVHPNGVVSFTFDDGFASHNTEAASYLQGKGFRGTSYIINDVIGTGVYMSTSQMQALQNTYDWEVGLHSATAADHNAVGGFTSLTTQQRRDNLAANRAFLVANGITNPTVFAYPQGLFNQQTVTDLAPLVTRARTTKGVHLETVPPGSRMKMYTRAVDASTSSATITALIDQAKNNREWLILLFHDIVASGATGTEVNQSTFRTIVDYAQTAGVDVLPVGEVLAGTPVTGSAATAQANQTSSASGTVSSGAVTGTVAATQASQTSSASGQLRYSGTVAATQAANTSTASGQLRYSGTSATTQASQTSTASGILRYTGTVAVTQAAQTSSASGIFSTGIAGSVAATQANQTSATSGQLGYSGTSSATQAAQTSSAVGQLRYTGTSANTQAAQTSSASGAVVQPITGTVAATQAANTAAASGNVVIAITGTVAATQANQAAAATGVLRYTGALAVSQAANTAAATGSFITAITGTVAVMQANQTCVATGLGPNEPDPHPTHLSWTESGRHGNWPGIDRHGTWTEPSPTGTWTDPSNHTSMEAA